MKSGQFEQNLRLKLFSLLALALVIQTTQVTSSQAASSPNGKCPTLGATATIGGIKYICAKVGSKQVWNKAPSAPLVPTDEQKLESISDAIKVKLNSAKSEVDLSLNVDPLLKDSQWSKDSIASIPTANKLLAVMGVKPVNEMKIYVSWGEQYKNQFAPSYCQTPGGGGLCGQTGIILEDLKWFADSWGYGGVEAPYKSEMDRFTIIGNLQHEIGHYGQEESAADVGNKDYWMYNPGWLREGAAEYFKLLTSAYDNKVPYKKLHDLYLVNSGSKRCTKYPLLSMSKQNFNSDGCEYSKGLFAVELLVIKTGRANSIFDLQRTIGTDTASTFEKAYRFSLASFCKEADEYFAKITANLK